MTVWQIQEAKAQFTALIREAKQEPQIISRHGVSEIVVISLDKYEELIGRKDDLVSFLRKSPLNGVDLIIERDKSTERETDL